MLELSVFSLILAAYALGLLAPRKITIKQAASIIGKLGRQTQLRTQAEKTEARHAELRAYNAARHADFHAGSGQ